MLLRGRTLSGPLNLVHLVSTVVRLVALITHVVVEGSRLVARLALIPWLCLAHGLETVALRVHLPHLWSIAHHTTRLESWCGSRIK